MLDDPVLATMLVLAFETQLPAKARVSSRVLDDLARDNPDKQYSSDVRIERIDYVCDEVGFMCTVRAAGADDTAPVLVIALTHLIIDPGYPFARDIATYQRRRVKRLKRLDREPWRRAA